VSPRVGFQFGLVFPPDDLLSEWMATLAMAFNDLSLVSSRMDVDQETSHEFFYWLRLALAHYHEAGKYLDETSSIEQVTDYVASLGEEAQSLYQSCLQNYRSRDETLSRLRNQAVFHYPRLQLTRRRRPMMAALEELASEMGQFEKGEGGTIRESRLLFADDIASHLFVRASGGEENLANVHPAIQEGMTAFMRFTNLALEGWFLRALKERGAKLFDVSPRSATVEPSDEEPRNH
jgi:hypothetical protein